MILIVYLCGLPTFVLKTLAQPSQTFSQVDASLAQTSSCLTSLPETENESFFIQSINIEGNTVLHTEISQLTRPFNEQTVTLESLLCLRSQITDLYLANGYINSGAFLPNNQDLSQEIVTIQVREGTLEEIQIIGLQRLQDNYIRSRLQFATETPLNQKSIEEALELLKLDPLIQQINAELTAGKAPGQSILMVEVQEASAFQATIGTDNYRPPSIGSTQGIVALNHNNLLGWGDSIYAEYDRTEGLDFYNFSYTVPVNADDGTISFRYWNSDSGIISEEFDEFDINSENETLSFTFRQPIIKNLNHELSLGITFDRRREQTFLLDEPFSLSIAAENGTIKLTGIRFFKEYLNRGKTTVLAVRSQFNFGVDLFNPTINNIGVDGRFFSWQGQVQWVKQLSPRLLFLTSIDTQVTPDSLLPLEQIPIGGINSVRGYRQNKLLTDNGFIASIETQFSLLENSRVLQLTPFFELGTGWNHLLPDPDPATLISVGLGLRWAITSNIGLRVDYGIPLEPTRKQGNSWQENGFYFSLRYQPF
ncbi:ShlB/FhaC/HecB family hemolysin secretion/activation protein [Cyanothece sp. BG0011]|uniref:ShlB/FhaC/HecB family hemolysin secretion/activation protein n=1 Tax=Cyanothece sp. BG0011 TaxID=2082950 RepID=UPI00130040C7|nr:ShlB/FhaC/HecB family hemolysin secretion/activation protein [Cyanothece sp. BG0011]